MLMGSLEGRGSPWGTGPGSATCLKPPRYGWALARHGPWNLNQVEREEHLGRHSYISCYISCYISFTGATRRYSRTNTVPPGHLECDEVWKGHEPLTVFWPEWSLWNAAMCLNSDETPHPIGPLVKWLRWGFWGWQEWGLERRRRYRREKRSQVACELGVPGIYFLVAQRLSLSTLNAEGEGLIPGWGSRSHMPCGTPGRFFARARCPG